MKIYQSKFYQEFKERRGKPWSHFLRTSPTKKEIKEWKEAESNFKEVKNILSFLNNNLQRARGRETHSVSVDVDYVYEIGAHQDFFCALTGDELEFSRGGSKWLGKWCNPYSCTIDRIDSNKGYVKGNIQLITWKANCIKQHVPQDEFIEFCKDVAYWHK